MSDYTEEHASALADIREAGAAADIVVSSPGVHDPATDTWSTPTTTTTSGYALGKRGDPERYKTLGLVESESPTLLWCPTTYGTRPPLLGVITWESTPYTVRDVNTFAPNGKLITANIVVSR